MTLQIADRIYETTVSVGPTSFTLLGHAPTFHAVADKCAPGDTLYLTIAQQPTFNAAGVETTPNEWVTGIFQSDGAEGLTLLTVLDSSNGGAPVTFSGGTKDVFNCIPAERLPYQPQAQTTVRQALTGNVTYYVAKTGSDTTGDGSSGNPWLTLQHAANFIADLIDFNGFQVTVSVGPSGGTPYVGVWNQCYIGGGILYWRGDKNTPSNVVVADAVQPGFGFASGAMSSQVRTDTLIVFNGFRFMPVNAPCVDCDPNQVGLQNIVFSDFDIPYVVAKIELAGNQHNGFLLVGNVFCNGDDILIDGPFLNSPQAFWNNVGAADTFIGSTVTINGTPTFSTAFYMLEGGYHQDFATYTNPSAAIGSRFSIQANGLMVTGNGLLGIPGSLPGTVTGMSALQYGPSFPYNRYLTAFRQVLTADLTYFVSTTGNDVTGDGLTAGTAWASLTHAWKTICQTLDLDGHNITINVGAGSFDGFSTFGDCTGVDSSFNHAYQPVGGGHILIQGAGVASTTLTSSNRTDFSVVDIEHPIETSIQINGCLIASRTSDSGVLVSQPCSVVLRDCQFQMDGWYVIQAIGIGAVINITNISTACKITGVSSSPGFAQVLDRGVFSWYMSAACTLAGTLTVTSGWVVSGDFGTTYLTNLSFTGVSATGPRFNCFGNANIDTTLGLNALPGNALGRLQGGAIYGPGAQDTHGTIYGQRESILDSTRTYYVRSGGSDSNDGLTAATAFASITWAWKTICQTLDLAGHTVTIDVGAGSFDGFSTFGDCTGADSSFTNTYIPVGGGQVTIRGAGTASTTLTSSARTDSAVVDIEQNMNTFVVVTACLISAVTGNVACAAYAQCQVEFLDCWFHMDGAYVVQATALGANVSISNLNTAGKITGASSAPAFAEASQGANFIWIDIFTTVLAGTPAVTTGWLFAKVGGVVELNLTGFSGVSATGPRFSGSQNANFNTGGLALTFLPGNAAGVLTTGATWDSVQGPADLNGVVVWGNVPQNLQTGNYTTKAVDANQHIYETGTGTTVTIDSNANVPYPVGTKITFVTAGHSMSIAINADTLILGGTGTTGTRTLAANSVAEALKITSTSWIIWGIGLT